MTETLTPEQFAERVMQLVIERLPRGNDGVEPLPNPPGPVTPVIPVPVPVAPPWYRDRTFLASLMGMLAAVFTTIGAWLSQSASVEGKKQSEENGAQIKSVHKDVKASNKALGFPVSE